MSTDLVVPGIIAFIVGFAAVKKVDIFAAFTKGAKEGLYSGAEVLPALCFLMTAIGMLLQSGIFDSFAGFVSPLAEKIGFPAEVIPLAVMRPFSGSGALAYFEELCSFVPPDSFAGRVAAVLMGGSETTFYTVAVYYGAVGIKNGRNTVPAALMADISAAILSVFAVNLFLGR